MKCEARIVRPYKRAKSDSCWPINILPESKVYDLPVCDGTLKVQISAQGGGGCSCCAEPVRLVLVTECTKCKNGYHPKIQALQDRLGYEEYVDITDILEK